jgi:hypothetical protein
MIEKYVHHGAEVFVRSDLKGKHHGHCLCWICGNFKPGKPENCAIAQKLYEICVEHDLVTPVHECPKFKGATQ